MKNSILHNPHLIGDSFFWESGKTGIILLHGLTATTAEVRLFGKKLFDHGFTVAGPLLPGHGTHPEDLNKVDWHDWVDTAMKIFKKMSETCDVIFIGGESMGAVLSLYMASILPEIAGVLLFAPALRLAFKPLDVFKLYSMAPFIKYLPKGNMDVDRLWQGYPVNPLKGAIQLLRMQREVLKRLPTILQPILVLQGRFDTTIDPRCGEMIMALSGAKKKELYWLEESSHVILVDKELDKATELSLRFIESILEERLLNADHKKNDPITLESVSLKDEPVQERIKVTPIIEIQGIGKVYAKQLRDIGITSVEILIRQGATPKGRDKISSQSHINQSLILKWVNFADLIRINGIGPQYAELLEASGVDTVKELARRNPENLFATLKEINNEHHKVRKLPVLNQVRQWVEEAKVLPHMVTY